MLGKLCNLMSMTDGRSDTKQAAALQLPPNAQQRKAGRSKTAANAQNHVLVAHITLFCFRFSSGPGPGKLAARN